jgi:hypothetical protein|tara:strand:- start:477 stop:722 length:246 start_codon:yes stop_codon:yes gene_type:complete
MNTIKEDTSIDKIDNTQELRDSLKRALLTNKTSKSLDEKRLQSDYVNQNSANKYFDDWMNVSINVFLEEWRHKSKSLDINK